MFLGSSVMFLQRSRHEI